jgi:hypothetical protein
MGDARHDAVGDGGEAGGVLCAGIIEPDREEEDDDDVGEEGP